MVKNKKSSSIRRPIEQVFAFARHIRRAVLPPSLPARAANQRVGSSARRITKTSVLALLVAVVLSACAGAVDPVPTAIPIPPPAPTAIVPTGAAQPVTAAVASSDPQALLAALDSTFQSLTDAGQFSGSVVIAKDGQVLLSKGYGFADRDKVIPNTVQTRFRIYKMTKQFTAMAIMMLQEQGKLNVQDKMCADLTGCPEAWTPITIHQLLTHTSGIPDSSADDTVQLGSSAPLEEMIAGVKTKPLGFQPGERFYDDDMDYVLLGKVIEAVSGQSYAEFLQESIFDPLQMLNTGFDPTRDDLAVGYHDQSSVAQPLNYWVHFSNSGLYSSVDDLYRWDQALYTDQLVPQKVLDTMFTSYVQSDRDGFGYGYGWYVSLDKPLILRAYPTTRAARKVIQAQAK
jgi:CubicO group peptidase (beta-lactamase class C family)